MGMMWSTSRALWRSWAPQHSQRPLARVSTRYFTEPLIGVLAEGIETLPAQLLQRVALGVAQLVAADQAVGAVAVGGDAVAGEHLAHHPLPRIRRATSCAGAGVLLPSSSRSMSGWSMGLMRIRLAIYARRRRKTAEGLLAMA